MKIKIALLILFLFLIVYDFIPNNTDDNKIYLEKCGYSEIENNKIIIHTRCKITIEPSEEFKIEENEEIVKVYIPNGWGWRIVP